MIIRDLDIIEKGCVIIKAIIFDFDGTLADTLPICFYAFQSVFKDLENRTVSPDEIKAMFGPSETGIIKKYLMPPNHDRAINLYYEKYNERHQELVPENQEINDLLLFLKGEGYKLGIVTGKASKSLFISLNHLKMNRLFDVIITGDDVSFPKPHPEGLNKALEQLNVQNTEAIFLGDSDADLLAGKRANVYTIAVQWLPNFQNFEFKSQPDLKLTNINEFLPALNRLTQP